MYLCVCVCTAFHASPNVYKRKTKEIRKETEPCGLDCFLLQVTTNQHSLTLPKLHPHQSMTFPSSSLSEYTCRKERKSLRTSTCWGHGGLVGAVVSHAPPAQQAPPHQGQPRRGRMERVTMRPQVPLVHAHARSFFAEAWQLLRKSICLDRWKHLECLRGGKNNIAKHNPALFLRVN